MVTLCGMGKMKMSAQAEGERFMVHKAGQSSVSDCSPQFHSFTVCVKLCHTHATMSNITLSVDENTYRTARIVAAERGTSVSALVRDYLQSLRPNPNAADHAALVKTLNWAASTGNFSAEDRLSRENIHDRAAMRRELDTSAADATPGTAP